MLPNIVMQISLLLISAPTHGSMLEELIFRVYARAVVAPTQVISLIRLAKSCKILSLQIIAACQGLSTRRRTWSTCGFRQWGTERKRLSI